MKRLHKRKQRAYNKARNTGKEEDWELFRELRKKIKKATRNLYRKYVRDKCLESTKQFWSFVKSLALYRVRLIMIGGKQVCPTRFYLSGSSDSSIV